MELREWQYMNKPAGSTVNNSSSSGYRKRFEKLIEYHIDHASPELESITTKDIKDDGFRLGEHYNTGTSEFDREIKVSYDTNNSTFVFSIRIDNILVEKKTMDSYEKLVERLESYMFLPDEGTSEYDDLLVEWVVMNNSTTNNSQPASKTNKEKFEELTEYMKKNKSLSATKAEVVRLDANGFTYKEYWRALSRSNDFVLTLVVKFSGSSCEYELYMDTNLIKEAKCSSWEELLEELEKYFHVPKAGSQEYESLCESAGSMADDFKLYENLWN